MIIHAKDNVEIRSDGHKYARTDIPCGTKIIKYGMPIGSATGNIACGEHVHTHNCKTDLEGILEYTYEPDFTVPEIACNRSFMGYQRPDGQVGIRNDIWATEKCGLPSSNTFSTRVASYTLPVLGDINPWTQT